MVGFDGIGGQGLMFVLIAIRQLRLTDQAQRPVAIDLGQHAAGSGAASRWSRSDINLTSVPPDDQYLPGWSVATHWPVRSTTANNRKSCWQPA
jgi:hypothetical protein